MKVEEVDPDSAALKALRQQMSAFTRKLLNFTITLNLLLIVCSIVFVGILLVPLHVDPVLFSFEIIVIFTIDFILFVFVILLVCFYTHQNINVGIAFASMLFIGKVMGIVFAIYIRYSLLLTLDQTQPK